MPKTIPSLIINKPHEEPSSHWHYDRSSREFEQRDGRRPAGYITADPQGRGGFDDPGVFHEIEMVNTIRRRMADWRRDGRPGMTGTTTRLWQHWTEREEGDRKFFFCQIEAIETLIFWLEAPERYRTGINLGGDGGPIERLCSKMATGTGKTVVISMILAWQILNKVAYPRDTRFSKSALLVAPGLTVKSRLGVILPGAEGNYFEVFNIVPVDLRDRLSQGQIHIINWHALMPLKEKERSVVKKGKESDEAFVQRVLGPAFGKARNMIVINDEAHHAWRISGNEKLCGEVKKQAEEATQWMEGLDRIHDKRGVLRCFDLSATPFRPTGKKSGEDLLFDWIISDFGLSDAIESGLVKTPRVVVRSDGAVDTKTMKPKLYHIYMDPEVREDLVGKHPPEASVPDLVDRAYRLLAADWLDTLHKWQAEKSAVPPVMITVCNTTHTAARVEQGFISGDLGAAELHDPRHILRIDSKVLENAEHEEEISGKKDKVYRQRMEDIIAGVPNMTEVEKSRLLTLKDEELLREIVDSVGAIGKAGEQVRHVIAVAMLSEGWDTKNVTHIMGLRAFSSQLLCEQVVGRGLRRVSYDLNEDGKFEPEYVNIFGVPFSFMPHEGGEDGTAPSPTKPTTYIHTREDRENFAISWPNITRINRILSSKLDIDEEALPPLEIDASAVTSAEIGDAIDGKPMGPTDEIDLEKKAEAGELRPQELFFSIARRIIGELAQSYPGRASHLFAEIMGITERFLASDKLVFSSYQDKEGARRTSLICQNRSKIANHIRSAVRDLIPTEEIKAIFDTRHPLRSTADLTPWHTTKPAEHTRKCHISHVVSDSSWELSEAFSLDHKRNEDLVVSWAKNDHLGFEIPYLWRGIRRLYRPDFLVKMCNGVTIVLEVKGKIGAQEEVKKAALEDWVEAVNADGRYGQWASDISSKIDDLRGILEKHSK